MLLGLGLGVLAWVVRTVGSLQHEVSHGCLTSARTRSTDPQGLGLFSRKIASRELQHSAGLRARKLFRGSRLVHGSLQGHDGHATRSQFQYKQLVAVLSGRFLCDSSGCAKYESKKSGHQSLRRPKLVKARKRKKEQTTQVNSVQPGAAESSPRQPRLQPDTLTVLALRT